MIIRMDRSMSFLLCPYYALTFVQKNGMKPIFHLSTDAVWISSRFSDHAILFVERGIAKKTYPCPYIINFKNPLRNSKEFLSCITLKRSVRVKS
jgi:hypothetical protein